MNSGVPVNSGEDSNSGYSFETGVCGNSCDAVSSSDGCCFGGRGGLLPGTGGGVFGTFCLGETGGICSWLEETGGIGSDGGAFFGAFGGNFGG